MPFLLRNLPIANMLMTSGIGFGRKTEANIVANNVAG
jgi:hypothetical protein